MTLAIISSGIDTSFSTKLNNNTNECLVLQGLNTIRQLLDRSITFSQGLMDGWGEAYVSASGRLSSVDTTASITTAIFITNKYYPAPETSDFAGSMTTNDPDGFTNVANAFDGNNSTEATYAFSGTVGRNLYLGKTYASAVGPAKLTIKASWTGSGGNGGDDWYIYLEGYNGSSWIQIATLDSVLNNTDPSACSYDDVYYDSTGYLGYRINFNYSPASSSANSGTAHLYTLEIRRLNAEGVIVHTIPANTFSSTISKAICVPHFALYETGCDVDYKLTNTSEDTGYLGLNAISSFTAFTSSPTKLTVKLIPKTSTPTTGYPAIYGSWVRTA